MEMAAAGRHTCSAHGTCRRSVAASLHSSQPTHSTLPPPTPHPHTHTHTCWLCSWCPAGRLRDRLARQTAATKRVCGVPPCLMARSRLPTTPRCCSTAWEVSALQRLRAASASSAASCLVRCGEDSSATSGATAPAAATADCSVAPVQQQASTTAADSATLLVDEPSRETRRGSTPSPSKIWRVGADGDCGRAAGQAGSSWLVAAGGIRDALKRSITGNTAAAGSSALRLQDKARHLHACSAAWAGPPSHPRHRLERPHCRLYHLVIAAAHQYAQQVGDAPVLQQHLQALLAGGKRAQRRRRLHQLRRVAGLQRRHQQLHGAQLDVLLLLPPVADHAVLDAAQRLQYGQGGEGRSRAAAGGDGDDGGEVRRPLDRAAQLQRSCSNRPILQHDAACAQRPAAKKRRTCSLVASSRRPSTSCWARAAAAMAVSGPRSPPLADLGFWPSARATLLLLWCSN